MYGAVPPPGATVATPLLPPLQLTWVVVEALAVTGAGSEIVTVAIAEQPKLSATTTVYIPALRPVAVAVEFDPGVHK